MNFYDLTLCIDNNQMLLGPQINYMPSKSHVVVLLLLSFTGLDCYNVIVTHSLLSTFPNDSFPQENTSRDTATGKLTM